MYVYLFSLLLYLSLFIAQSSDFLPGQSQRDLLSGQSQGQLGSLGEARTPPRAKNGSRRAKVVLPKRQPKATAVATIEGEEEDEL